LLLLHPAGIPVAANGQSQAPGADPATRVVVGYLSSNESDVPGYPQYNYILIREPISADSRSTTARLLGPIMDALTDSKPTTAVNNQKSGTIVYFLVLMAPPEHPDTTWLTDQYDYARSTRLLNRLGAGIGDGPFLAVSEKPILADINAMHGAVKLFDLSAGQQPALPSWTSRIEGMGEEIRSGFEHQFTGRDFLLPRSPEPTDYGLYSYVLFGEHINPSNRDLYEAIVASYLNLDEVRRFQSEGVDKKALNVTYLPLLQPAPQEPTAAWVLDNYDYVAAQVLLKKLTGADDTSGAYLVSYDKPASAGTDVDRRRLLVQNLSGVPPNLAFLWIREFKAQVRQSQYWDQKTVGQLMLRMRTQLAVVARAFSEVRKADPNLGTFVATKIRMQQ
jgi:hypothetical protein